MGGFKTGLVLVGGGARGAYQAGVLKGMSEILSHSHADRPFFDIITGISAGGINAAYLGSRANCMVEAAEALYQLWYDIRAEQVMRTDAAAIAAIGSRWLRDLSLGGMMPNFLARTNSLLDTTPLREFIARQIDFAALERALANDTLHAFALSATNYHTGTAVTFYDAHPEISGWTRSARMGWRTRLRLEHVLASAAIPILFKPVMIEGAYYGDGGIRMSTPLSPAIHLGSDRVMSISIRHPRSDEQTMILNRPTKALKDVSVADIAGVMLNAAFLDALDSDAERMLRINQTIELMSEEQRLKHPHRLRTIPLLVIRPSVDLGTLANDQFKRFPRALKYVMRGIGASDEMGSDFISYIAFDPAYTRPLLELGYKDALKHRDQIEAFYLPGESTS
ncbi:patatin-like phospholipase family protein [Bdellovibrionota bacterium FG-1]